MQHEPTLAPAATLENSNLRFFSQWVIAFGPPIAITVAGLTVFYELIVRSISSSSHPILVHIILGAFFVGLVFCVAALFRYQREALFIRHWHSAFVQKVKATALPNHRSCSSSSALAAFSLNLKPAQRYERFEIEVTNVRAALSDRLAYANYIAGALIGLGLVGTFVGLLGTLEDLGAVFGSLVQSGNSEMNPTVVFSNMVNKLQEPMKGMGTAFVSSLYGLLGSLLVGLCALSVSKAGAVTVRDLLAVGRMAVATQFSEPSEEPLESPKEMVAHQSEWLHSSIEQNQKIYHLQTLLETLLRAQIESENRLHDWLESGENRLTKVLAKTLEAHWSSSSDMTAIQQQFIDQLSATLQGHEQEAQELVSRMALNEEKLGQDIVSLLAVNANKHNHAQAEILDELERESSARRHQVDDVLSAITGLTAQVKRSADAVDHLQSRAQHSPAVSKAESPQKADVREKSQAPQAIEKDGLSLLAQSLERQTRLLEEVVRHDRSRR
jgi:hypothetical protein